MGSTLFAGWDCGSSDGDETVGALVVKLRRDGPEPRHRPLATDDAIAAASTEELLLELPRRFIRPRDRRRGTW